MKKLFSKQKQMRIFFFILLYFCLTSCYDHPSGKKLAIQPLGYFPKEYTDSVASAVHNFYGFEVVELQQQQIPEEFFTFPEMSVFNNR